MLPHNPKLLPIRRRNPGEVVLLLRNFHVQPASIPFTAPEGERVDRRLACILFILMAVVAAAAQSPELLIKQGHWKRARPLVEAAYSAKPADPTVLAQMSRVKKMFGDL